MKYINLVWPLVLVTTVGLYLLILVTLPFNQQFATVLLFTLIAYWSRLPGVGIQHPFFILYQMDVIDIFMILIAINIGVAPAIMFIWFTNNISRLSGTFPDWSGVIQDSKLLTIIAVFVPILNAITGGNLLIIITIYSIFRPIGFFLFNFIWPRMSWPQRIITSLVAGGEVFVINAFYAKLFGGFFDRLLGKGVAFYWPLFIFATVVIFTVYIAFYGVDSLSPKKKTTKKIVKAFVKKVHQPHQPKHYGSENPISNVDQSEMNFVRETFK